MDVAMELTPLPGGFSGETFVSESFGQRVVVRIYGGRSAARGPQAVGIDAALLRLMRGIVPVPTVLEVRRPGAELPGLLVTEFLPGTRADLLLPTLDEEERGRLGANLGRILDRLVHVPTLRAGRFADPELRIEEFPSADGLPGWVEAHRAALTSWGPGELDGLAALAERAQDLLDTVERTCLVHSDFNPKNLLVDPETLEVTGLLDWEFAHSGSPFSDLGNLLRFERDEAFTAGVLGGLDRLDQRGARLDHRGARLDHRGARLELARAADLFALVDLAARDHDEANRHQVTAAADALLRAMAGSGDLHATAP